MAEKASISSQSTSCMAFFVQAVAGVVVFIIAYVALCFISIPVFILASAADFVGTVFNGALLVLALVLWGFGKRRRKPGLAWSPVIFCALWLCASVVNRMVLALSDTTLASSSDLPTAINPTNGSLTIIGAAPAGIIELLAERRVRQVVISEDDGGKLRRRSYVLRAGPACDSADKGDGFTDLYKQGGVFGECVVREPISSEPDGAIVSLDIDGPGRRIGRFIIRQDRQDSEVARWESTRRVVLSYLPVPFAPIIGLYAGDNSDAGAWRFAAGGPTQFVYLGKVPFTTRDMVEAIVPVKLSEPISPRVQDSVSQK